MALVTVSNNSLTAVTAIPASIPTGALTLIKSITASASASISFVDGTDGVVLDDTYKSYVFKFINIHPQNDGVELGFNFSTDGGSNYNVTKTTTFWYSVHNEDDSNTQLAYDTAGDLAQSTSFQRIQFPGNDNDQSVSGKLCLFNPSSTTYVKHFMAVANASLANNNSVNVFPAGYCNTTSAVDAVQFKFASGNIDDGIIKLYGVK